MLKMANFEPRGKFGGSWKIVENRYGVPNYVIISPCMQQQRVETTDLILSPPIGF
jgi:hypothetical protein